MPHELNERWLANSAVMPQLLFASVHETLIARFGDPKYLGAAPGIIATLHTWSQTLVLHPHGHGLVTGGGLHAAGQGVALRVRGGGRYVHSQGDALPQCRQKWG